MIYFDLPPTGAGTLSEYYRLRRRSIKDVTGLIFFVLGWFAAAPFGWPYIVAGFEFGDVTKGVFQFFVAVFGGACLLGITGLGVGALGGWIWEQAHRSLRRRHPVQERPAAPAKTSPSPPAPPPLPPLPPIRYADDAVRADDYLALARGVTGDDLDPRKTAGALDATINIGAWDGTRLVGIARVLSDGYLSAVAAEVMVDPDYRRRGVGRELMNRAWARTPRGALFVGAPGAEIAFLERLGCERGPAGFTMRRAARAPSQPGQSPA